MNRAREAWSAVYSEALQRYPDLVRKTRSVANLRNTTKGIVYTYLSVAFVFVSSLLSSWRMRSWALPDQVVMEMPLNFVFRTCDRVGVCSFPVANVSTIRSDGSSFFDRTVRYDAVLALTLLDYDGRPQRVIRKSTSFPYRSWAVQYLQTVLRLPLTVLGLVQEVQSQDIYLFQNYPIVDDEPPYLSVRIQNMNLNIVRSRLILHANLGLLDWLLFYWPLSSFVALFALNFVFFSFLTSLFWLQKLIGFAIRQLSSQDEAMTANLSHSAPERSFSPILSSFTDEAS
ncbi:unnamed protein product [Soboliphyme baturini]|uniref:Seipin n=1 Tax=Soboliphyme baturini TaxID=241478 RepID=A0A183ID28_9BILA|nr:unnamed protein product [Soboliphyme baturini]